MANIGSGRVLRVCDLCGGVDDGPRHVIAGTVAEAFPKPSDDIIAKVAAAAPPEEVGRLIAELVDTSSSDRHMDCCRTVGCPKPLDDPDNCANKTAGAETKRGAELVKHLMKEA